LLGATPSCLPQHTVDSRCIARLNGALDLPQTSPMPVQLALPVLVTKLQTRPISDNQHPGDPVAAAVLDLVKLFCSSKSRCFAASFWGFC
jgi:hypothetical protein